METVRAGCESKTDNMLWVIARGTIKHVKPTFVIDDAGIADGETFPAAARIRRKYWIGRKFIELHVERRFIFNAR